jgi:hypothetical protein
MQAYKSLVLSTNSAEFLPSHCEFYCCSQWTSSWQVEAMKTRLLKEASKSFASVALAGDAV